MGNVCSDACGGERGESASFRGLGSSERALCVKLSEELGQSQLFSGWRGRDLEERKRLASVLMALNESYDLETYVVRARALLAQAKAGANALEGWAARVPSDGEFHAVGSKRANAMEARGLQKLRNGKVGFVLVAGGLGERLGYSGIKLSLPTETTTGRRGRRRRPFPPSAVLCLPTVFMSTGSRVESRGVTEMRPAVSGATSRITRRS